MGDEKIANSDSNFKKPEYRILFYIPNVIGKNLCNRKFWNVKYLKEFFLKTLFSIIDNSIIVGVS